MYIYGKEVNPETFAICKSDMMIKDNDPENIKLGSTLATNDFSSMTFDFMLSNPPYGKSWKTDQKYIKDGKDVLDPRFQVNLKNYDGEIVTCDATPRSSDGQLLFLMEMADKMRKLADNPKGSRIASVHNGSSLFTGDAGGGESNIRRHLIEKDMVEAIIQLPNNLFYNTGITTYIWVVTNNKPAHRKGKVQLINASEMYTKRRKNLGNKNCDLSDQYIDAITSLYMSFVNEDVSKVFENTDFGYYKVTVYRPLRKKAQFTPERVATLRFTTSMQEAMSWVYNKYGDDVYTNINDHKQAIQEYLERQEITLSPKNRKALLDPETWQAQKDLMDEAEQLMASIGQDVFDDFNAFKAKVDADLTARKVKLTASQKNQILNAVSWRDEGAAKVVKKVHKLTDSKLSELMTKLDATKDELHDHGYWLTETAGEYIEYEVDKDLRDSENVPLKDNIHAYFLREVRPHVNDAWLDISSVKIGYEVSFNRYFYQHKPLRSLNEVAQEILDLEKETEGLLKRLVRFTGEQV